MARGSMSHFSSDYICAFCGDIYVCFDIGVSKECKYSIKQIYCPVCMTGTDHFRLGDSEIIKAQLESKDILKGIEYDIYNLLCTNDARKEKRLIKK